MNGCAKIGIKRIAKEKTIVGQVITNIAFDVFDAEEEK